MRLASRLAAAVVAIAGLLSPASPLRSQGIPVMPEGHGPVAAPAVPDRADSAPIGDVLARQARQMYLQDVRRAMLSAKFVVGRGATTLVERQIARKKAFDDNVDKILTLHARTLESIGAPRYALEVPGLHAEWQRTMSLMSRAEAASLYKPPEDLRPTLVFWRAMRDDRAAIDAAPWVVGPAEVSLDANLAPVVVPAGVWFLGEEPCGALAARRAGLRRAARAEIQGASAATAAITPHPVAGAAARQRGPACLRAADGRWNALLAIADRGHLGLGAGLPSRAGELLSRLRSRLDPVNNLKVAESSSYSADAVRWLISPEVDAAAATVRWATTNGAQQEPTGIRYAFMVLGASQQALVSTDGLQAAEIAGRIDLLPAEQTQEDAGPEPTLARVREALAPLETSLRFLPGHGYRDAAVDAPRNPNDVESLITGTPSPMEKGVQRILAEQQRRGDFSLFLADHPRLLAAFIGLAVAAFYVAAVRLRRRG